MDPTPNVPMVLSHTSSGSSTKHAWNPQSLGETGTLQCALDTSKTKEKILPWPDSMLMGFERSEAMGPVCWSRTRSRLLILTPCVASWTILQESAPCSIIASAATCKRSP